MSWAFSLCYMFDHLIQSKWTGSILTTTFTTRKDRKDLSEWHTGKKQSQENRGNEKKNQRLRAAAAFESLENTSGNVEIAFGMEFAYYNFWSSLSLMAPQRY